MFKYRIGLAALLGSAAFFMTVPVRADEPAGACLSNGLCDLGSLAPDGSGNSMAMAVSADGKTVVGSSWNGQIDRAFLWDGSGMYDLGSTGGAGVSSLARFVSVDGSVVSGDDIYGGRTFRWTASTGMIDIGSLRDDNSGYTFNYGMSQDGTTIVGESKDDDGQYRAYRWTEATGLSALGTLKTTTAGASFALGVSGNGSVIVGQAANDDDNWVAFRWTEGSGMTDIVGPSPFPSIANDVSTDGSAIMGTLYTPFGTRGFRWTEGGGVQELGSIDGVEPVNVNANAISADGSVIVGDLGDTFGRSYAFRWKDGQMTDLGSLVGQAPARAMLVSGDGNVVVGQAATGLGWNAFRWSDNGEGMISLGTLREDGTGDSTAFGVSYDGSVIVGQASSDTGYDRAFIYGTQMQDLVNVVDSTPLLASQTERTIAALDLGAGRLMDSACRAEEGAGCIAVGGSLGNGGIGVARSAVSSLGYARGLAGGVQIGGTLALGAARDADGMLSLGRTTGMGLWSGWAASGTGEGFLVGAALGRATADATISRGIGLDDVMVATGEAGIETRSARAVAGYGVKAGADWLVTAQAGLARFSTTRDAYAESGSDFNARYDALTVGRTTASFDLLAERKVGAAGTLSLGAGVDHDLVADETVLTGTSTLPGLETLAVAGGLERRDTRGRLSAGYTVDLGDARSFGGTIRVEEATYGGKADASLTLGYSVSF